jgi:HEAT repeat protein
VAALLVIVDKDKIVREPAVKALGDIGPPAKAAVPALIRATEDKNIEFRLQAVIALGRIAPQAKEVHDTLGKSLSDSQLKVQERAGDVLKAIGKPAVPTLIRVSRDSDPKVAGRAITILGDIGPDAKEAQEVLKEALKNRVASIRDRAAAALSKIDPKEQELVAGLIDVVRGQDEGARDFAFQRLQKLADRAKEAVPVLLTAMVDRDARVRQQAITALAAIDPKHKEVLSALRKASLDEREDLPVRLEALNALGRGGKAAVPFLQEALKEVEKPEVLVHAAKSLQKIGPDAKDAVPGLRFLLEDNTEEVRRAAADALRAIAPEELKKQ